MPSLRPFLWVAYPKMLGGYPAIVDLALALGFGGLAPRAGQGAWNDPTLRPDDVRAIRDAGLDCLPWIYSLPRAVEAEVDAFHGLEEAGATHAIIDAEVPWDKAADARERALRYGELYRARCTLPVYDAPWPAILWHAGYPEAAFRWVDGRMIQAYWTEIGWTAEKTFAVLGEQWGRTGERPERLLPVGVTYGRAELVGRVTQLPPRDFTDADLEYAAKRVRGGWYTAEAAGLVDAARLAHIAALLGLRGTSSASAEPLPAHALATQPDAPEWYPRIDPTPWVEAAAGEGEHTPTDGAQRKETT